MTTAAAMPLYRSTAEVRACGVIAALVDALAPFLSEEAAPSADPREAAANALILARQFLVDATTPRTFIVPRLIDKAETER